MTSTLRTFEYVAKSESSSLKSCETLVIEAEQLTGTIEHLLQELFILNDNRIECFMNIRKRWVAIQNRFRFLFGSHDEDYKAIVKQKI